MYDMMISRATGRTDPKELAAIEDLMRSYFGTLDGLPSDLFRSEACECAKVVDHVRDVVTNMDNGCRKNPAELADCEMLAKAWGIA